ncbi:MFS transporter [Psychrosphaera ytuae]|uniref:MFS transporter n=1 Tax=Psychrosphaera ytuae TaxID=2820710 RepID=A0A975DAV3_9GAMM|nr:MFS transporter [Psychrosphaera ytuae]QTH63757.1 MFS transporter [Psychrosphaera ytuae]
MQSDISFSRLKEFPPLMWILLFGSFITRGSFYMVWPFLAVILYERFGLSATEVGLILSGSAVASVLISFVCSALSDLVGRTKMMFATGILYIVSFVLLAEATTVTQFVIVIGLCSVATSLWRPLISALVGDIIPQPQTRELALQGLYFIVNVGCAIGPIVGVWLGLTGEQSSFYLTVYAFAFLMVLLAFGFKDQQKRDAQTSQISSNQQEIKDDLAPTESPVAKKSEFKTTLTLLLHDRLLQCLILANLICMFVYAQMDTTLIQYLTRAEVPELLSLISTLIFTNAMIIITLQFPLLKLMARVSLINRIQVGLGLLLLSQIWMASNPVNQYWGWIGAIALLSVAETILFPTMNVHIDRIAPNHLRGAYFGAASFYEFGYAFAPLGGGLILDHLSGSWVFTIGAGLILVVMFLYHILERMPRPDFAKL